MGEGRRGGRECKKNRNMKRGKKGEKRDMGGEKKKSGKEGKSSPILIFKSQRLWAN